MDYIDKLSLAKRLVNEKGLTIDEDILVGHTTHAFAKATDASLSTTGNDPVTKAYQELPANAFTVLQTGWDLASAKGLARKAGIAPAAYACEFGYAIEHKGTPFYQYGTEPVDVVKARHASAMVALYTRFAHEGRKIAVQGNRSLVECIYLEAQQRSNLDEHEHVKGKIATPWQIQRELGNGFYTASDGKIRFSPTDENILRVHKTLKNSFPLQSLRLGYSDGEMTLALDPVDRTDVVYENIGEIVENAIGTELPQEAHKDLCVDILPLKADVSTEAILRKVASITDLERIPIFHSAHKPADVLQGENTLFFAVEKSEAQKKADELGIMYVPVTDATEYFRLVKSLVG